MPTIQWWILTWEICDHDCAFIRLLLGLVRMPEPVAMLWSVHSLSLAPVLSAPKAKKKLFRKKLFCEYLVKIYRIIFIKAFYPCCRNMVTKHKFSHLQNSIPFLLPSQISLMVDSNMISRFWSNEGTKNVFFSKILIKQSEVRKFATESQYLSWDIRLLQYL
jgi:hypothetical protein